MILWVSLDDWFKNWSKSSCVYSNLKNVSNERLDHWNEQWPQTFIHGVISTIHKSRVIFEPYNLTIFSNSEINRRRDIENVKFEWNFQLVLEVRNRFFNPGKRVYSFFRSQKGEKAILYTSKIELIFCTGNSTDLLITCLISNQINIQPLAP